MISTSFPGKSEDTQGVNLLTGTKDFSGASFENKSEEKYNDFEVIYAKLDTEGTKDIIRFNNLTSELRQTYTMSFFAKGNGNLVCYFYNNDSGASRVIRYLTSQGNTGNSNDGNCQFDITEEWKRYWVQWTIGGTGDVNIKKTLLFRLSGISESYICGVKLEKGTVPNPQWTPAPEDVVTKIPYDIFTALDPIPEMHRNLYGGRNLGESTQMSEAHKKAIQDGSFKDLWVGDYWTHDGINYRIADADYLYNYGDTAFTTHHLVIVPDSNIGNNKQMNATNSTDGGYVGSDMRKTNMADAKEKIEAAFPNMVLTHREYLVNQVTNGHPSSAEWIDSEVDLMNEIMVYGCLIFTPANNGTAIPALYTIDISQLALFRLKPCIIKTGQNYWLRDVVSASHFAFVYAYGGANYNSASNAYVGVRPYFCIGVQPSGDEADDDMEVVSPMQEGDSGMDADSTKEELRREMDSSKDGAETGPESDVTKADAEQELDATEDAEREPDTTEDAEREPDTTKEKMQEV